VVIIVSEGVIVGEIRAGVPVPKLLVRKLGLGARGQVPYPELISPLEDQFVAVGRPVRRLAVK
jgi:hypothetical protein